MKGDQGLFSDLRMNYHQAYKMIREQINSEYESIINQGDIFLARKVILFVKTFLFDLKFMN